MIGLIWYDVGGGMIEKSEEVAKVVCYRPIATGMCICRRGRFFLISTVNWRRG